MTDLSAESFKDAMDRHIPCKEQEYRLKKLLQEALPYLRLTGVELPQPWAAKLANRIENELRYGL